MKLLYIENKRVVYKVEDEFINVMELVDLLNKVELYEITGKADIKGNFRYTKKAKTSVNIDFTYFLILNN